MQRNGMRLNANISLLLIPVAVCLLFAGCADSGDSKAEGTADGRSQQTDAGAPIRMPGKLTPEQQAALKILDESLAAYRHAKSYVDEGYLRLQYEHGGQKVDRKMRPFSEFSLAFVRPNKLRLQAYNTEAVCDGEHLYERILQFQDQVLAADAPAKLTLEAIYADPIFTTEASQKMPLGGNWPLAFLLHPQPRQLLLGDNLVPTLEEAEKVNGHLCHRIKIARPDGDLVVLVDQKSHVVRRLIAPIKNFQKTIDPQGQLKNLSVSAEFKEAEFNVEVSDQMFLPELPEKSVLVNYFVDAQPPSEPSPLLGKKIHDFQLTALDGSRIRRDDLKGKVVVLDMWASWCGPCVHSLSQLEQVRRKFKDVDSVQFYAVNVEDAEVKNDFLKELFSKWGVGLPILRDDKRTFQAGFDASALPQMFILDDEGVVQVHEVGVTDGLGEYLPDVINEVRAGKNLKEDAIRRYEDERTSYNQAIQKAAYAAGRPAKRAEPEPPPAEPQQLKLTKLWSISKLQMPSNILAVGSSGDAPTLLVNEGWRSVATVSLAGKVLDVRELDLPEGAATSYLRTAVDGQGKRYFLASLPAANQVHVFDENFKHLFSHPQDPQSEEISDAEMGDLDGDGDLEIVLGYFQIAGVHGVSMSGQREWVNRSLEHSWSLALSGRDSSGKRTILAANKRGTLVPIFPDGKNGNDVVVGRTASHPVGRYLKFVHAADINGDGAPELIGVAATESGPDIVVGIGPGGQELWKYELAAGLHGGHSQPICGGRIAGVKQGVWVIADRAQTLHFITAGGQRLDHFQFPRLLSGLALVQHGPRTLLVASSFEMEEEAKEGEESQMTSRWVEAWEVRSPQGK